MAELDPKTKSDIDRLVTEYKQYIPAAGEGPATLRDYQSFINEKKAASNDRKETLKPVTKKRKKKPTAFQTVKSGIGKGVRAVKTRLQELEEEAQRLQERGNPYSKFRDFGKRSK